MSFPQSLKTPKPSHITTLEMFSHGKRPHIDSLPTRDRNTLLGRLWICRFGAIHDQVGDAPAKDGKPGTRVWISDEGQLVLLAHRAGAAECAALTERVRELSQALLDLASEDEPDILGEIDQLGGKPRLMRDV